MRNSYTVIRLILPLCLLAGFSFVFGQQSNQSAAPQSCILQGTVSVGSDNGPGERLPGASLSLISVESGEIKRSTVTDENGEYKFTDLLAGLYTLRVALPGFEQQTKSVSVQENIITVENVSLKLAGITADVTIVTDGEALNTTDSAEAVSFKQNTLQTVPLVNERFQDVLPLVPGVVRGPDGLLNLKGARSSQSGFIVNSASVTDPVTGESSINLPLEAVESVAVLTNPYAPEYGQFTGAVTSVQTKSGGKKFAINGNSFFPRIRRRGGSFVGIGAFTPRVTISGPILKDKLRFMQSFEYRFVRTPVESLPPLQRDTGLESFDSVSQLDWEIDNKNHLTTTLSLFPQKLRYVGLNTFNPQEVTPNFKQRGFLWALNERRLIDSKSILESSFSIKQFDADVFPSSGSAPMNLGPDVNSGNFFNLQTRRSKRYQALEVYSFSPPKFAGEHFMKVGGGINYLTFEGANISHSLRVLRADGTRNQQLDFVGSGQLDRNETQFLAYFADKWTTMRRLTIDYGVRYDRNNIAGENNFAPRVGFAFLPLLDGRTVVRGGLGLFYGDINLNVSTFTQLQERVLTRFGPDGQEITGIPQRQRFELLETKLHTPRSVNWNLQFDREWFKNLFVRVGYQQRQSRREFIINPIPDADESVVLALTNSGSSRYREVEVTARYTFLEQNEFTASYVRSSSQGDLNDFNGYFGNFENPIIQANERSRLPWDAPDRLLFRGNFHWKYGLTFAPVLDVRTGFPYSVIDEERKFVGVRNRAGRFPKFVSLDLQVLKSVNLPGRWSKYRADVGVKVFNLTNHFNPRDLQNNLASDSYGVFSNGVGQMYGTRITLVQK